jgi:hypothetical protein
MGWLSNAVFRENSRGIAGRTWLPPRDSNPDSLLQRQVS